MKHFLYIIPFLSLALYLFINGTTDVVVTGLLIITGLLPLIINKGLFTGRYGLNNNDPTSLFANIIENLADPLLLLDENKKIIMANKSATDVFGNNLVKHDISDYLVDTKSLKAIKKAIKSGKSDTVEYISAGPRKRSLLLRIHVLENSAPLNEESKTGRTIFLGIYDITSIREAERMRVDFVANVSHELRTPLASILGFIETLQGPAKGDSASTTRFLKIMEDESKRMSRLIEDLLSLSQIERDVHILPEEYVSLRDIINSTIQTLNKKMVAKEMTTNFTSAENINKISGDYDQLIQVFINLIENAIKYGEEGSVIDINLGRYVDPTNNKRFAKITVANQGAGIAPEHIQRLTERFYRVDTARSRSLGGTGLGLAIVKHIIHRHEGRLFFQSKIGENTTATILLPLYS